MHIAEFRSQIFFSSLATILEGSVAERVKCCFSDEPDRMIWVQPGPCHVVASLNKTNALRVLSLLGGFKKQIQRTKIRRNPQRTLITENS